MALLPKIIGEPQANLAAYLRELADGLDAGKYRFADASVMPEIVPDGANEKGWLEYRQTGRFTLTATFDEIPAVVQHA